MSEEKPLIIREYTEADHDIVYALILSILEMEYQGLSTSSYLFDVDHVHQVYSGQGDRFWVAEQDGKIIATIAVKEDDEKTALLRRFFVNPNHRHKGVGGKLYQHALNFCQEHGYREIIFIANDKMEAANRFLKQRNFKDIENITFKKESHHSYGVYKLANRLAL